jgi:hypothetical protein
MTPTQEVSERQRKAAYKAWETIRRKRAAVADVPKRKVAAPAVPERAQKRSWNLRNYPANWNEIGIEIRNRARNSDGQQQCECRGECLKHGGRCEEINGTWAKYRRRTGKVKVRFTIAHLCHTPSCDDRSHLKAMCEPCHLIYDLRCRQRGLRGKAAAGWALANGA